MKVSSLFVVCVERVKVHSMFSLFFFIEYISVMFLEDKNNVINLYCQFSFLNINMRGSCTEVFLNHTAYALTVYICVPGIL